MGTEHISRTRALRSDSRFRPSFLARRGWFLLAAGSVLSCVISCALYVLLTAAPLAFAAHAPAQDTLQTQLSAELSLGVAPAMGSSPQPTPPPPLTDVREQRLSTVSGDDVGQPTPPAIPATEEPSATPPADATLVQTRPTEQTDEAAQTPEAERATTTAPPIATAPLAATDNAQAVDEVAATTTAGPLNTTETAGTAGATETAGAPSPTTGTAPSPASTAKAAGPAKETRRLFGTVEMRASIRDLRQWQDVQKRHADNPVFTPGFKLNASTSWDKLKSMLNDKPPLEKLRGVNSFWNQWPYKLDIANYSKEDYWAAPYEFRKNSGDCEDYAIVKYYTLKEMGIPVEQMRIVVLKDTILNVAHAILAVYLEDDIYILDNIAKNVLSHTRIRNYLPVYSVNEQYRWVHVRTK